MKIYVETYGCTANKSDESVLLGILHKEHYEIVDTSKDADILILLTCTVIGTTEQRMLARLKAWKKLNKRIIVAGCMPSVQPDLITAVVPDAQLLRAGNIYQICDVLNRKPRMSQEKTTQPIPRRFPNMIAPIAIAQGCLLSCSYCITHLARGTLLSKPRQEILFAVHTALKQGCREIQLTAQDTAAYGYDTKTNLRELLSDISTIPGEFRIRIGMMNPYTVQHHVDKILSVYSFPKLYKFLHLPLQSGDNTILKKMKRLYTVEDFIRIVQTFRINYPEITLSTDIIVGFPTETDEQFERTVTLLKTVRPDIVNITRYSARPYTIAKTMEGRIPTEIVKKRSTRVADFCKKLSKEKNREHIGKMYTILTTEKGKNDTVVGRTEHYKPVVINDFVNLGAFVPVKIVDAAPTHLVGKLI